jgi:hypothetical protein
MTFNFDKTLNLAREKTQDAGDYILENKLKLFITVLTLLTLIIGSALKVDSIYAHAADFQKIEKTIEELNAARLKDMEEGRKSQLEAFKQFSEQQTELSKQIKIENKYNTDMIRYENITYRKFDLESIPPKKRTAQQNAKIQEFKDQLRKIDSKWEGYKGD